MDAILAFDLGTGGVKAALFNERAEMIRSAFEPYRTYYLPGGIHEQAPDEWWAAVRKASERLFEASGLRAGDIRAVGVSGHSLGVVAVDGGGKLLAKRTPIWSDSRAGKQAERFFSRISRRRWYETTGNGFNPPLYSAFKLMWYKENDPRFYERADCFLGTKDYINFLMTGVRATDRSYASGSGVFDLRSDKYSGEYIAAADIQENKLPRVTRSSEMIGRLTRSAAGKLGLREGIPVAAGGVDNACMSLGAGCFRKGHIYASLGSSAWVSAVSDEPRVDYERGVYAFAHCIDGLYLPSSGIYAAGTALQWAAERLFAAEGKGSGCFEEIDRLAKESPPGANGLMFIPALAGGDSSTPSPNMKGALLGIELGHTRADIVRAVLEGVAYGVKRCYTLLRGEEKALTVAGGGASSAVGRQIYADILNVPIRKLTAGRDTAALGAAVLAGLGCGLYGDLRFFEERTMYDGLVRPNRRARDFYSSWESVMDTAYTGQAALGDFRVARRSIESILRRSKHDQF